MSDNDIKTHVLNYLQSIFPQASEPFLLQVILDTIQQAVPFCDYDEDIISQYCVNKVLEFSMTCDEGSPIKQMISPSRVSPQCESINNENTQVSSTSSMGESSRGCSTLPYKDNTYPSNSQSPSTSNIGTEVVNSKSSSPDSHSSKIPTSDTAKSKSPSLPSSDRTQYNKNMLSLLKRSSTTSKIRNLNADTICGKNKINTKTDDSEWLLVISKDVTNDQNSELATKECTSKELESFTNSSSAECASIPHEQVSLFEMIETSDPESNDRTCKALYKISSPATRDQVVATDPVSREETSEVNSPNIALNHITTTVARDSVVTPDPLSSKGTRETVNNVSTQAARDSEETSYPVSREGISNVCSSKAVNNLFTPAANDSGISEPQELDISSSALFPPAEPSQLQTSQTFPKEPETTILQSIPKIQNSTSPTETEDDTFVWIMNNGLETPCTGTSIPVSKNAQGYLDQKTLVSRNLSNESSKTKESSKSKESSSMFSSNYLLQASKPKLDIQTPPKTFSNNDPQKTPICSHNDDDVTPLNIGDGVEEGLDEIVTQVLEIFPDANASTVRYLLCDAKKENPEDFVSDVITMFLEGAPSSKQKGGVGKHQKIRNTKPHSDTQKVSNKSLSRGDNPVGDDSIASTSYVPQNITEVSRKRKADDRNEEDTQCNPSQNKAVKRHSNIVEVKNQEDMEFDNSVGNCEVCQHVCNICQLGQCCDGHITCSKCIEVQIKGLLLTNKIQKIPVKCQVKDCSSYLPLSEICRIMPPIIAEIIKDKLEQENLATIENLDDVVKCPECGHIGEVAHHKEIHCANTECRLSFCRFCKKSWNDCSHDNCTALLTTYNKAGSDNFLESYPKFWSHIDVETDKDFICIEVDVNSEEYHSISTKFRETVPKEIVSILRIQNTKLWQKYVLTRKHMIDDFGIQKLNELHLYHGTDPKNIELICQEGFDWRLSGKHGQAYGRGAYFAVNASYSDKYNQVVPLGSPNVLKSSNLGLFMDSQRKTGTHSDNTTVSTHASYTRPDSMPRNIFSFSNQMTMPYAPSYRNSGLQYMLVARVICGRSVPGYSGLTRPPSDLSDSKKRMYNSVTDGQNPPNIFCIFESAQTYPEYLIEYKSVPIGLIIGYN